VPIGELAGSHPNRLNWLPFKSALTLSGPSSTRVFSSTQSEVIFFWICLYLPNCSQHPDDIAFQLPARTGIDVHAAFNYG